MKTSNWMTTGFRIVVGRPSDNKVTILRCQADSSHWLYLPSIFK